jgi:hypothetical protein
MRLVSTIILCLLIIGGTWAYIDFDNGIKFAASDIEYGEATGTTTIQIERTFECFGNADFEEPAIKVTFGGNDVFLNESESILPEERIEFELANVENEKNAVTVYANATSPDSFGDDGPALRAMVVRVRYDDDVIAEKVFHANGSEPSLGGDVSFEIPVPDAKDDHDH